MILIKNSDVSLILTVATFIVNLDRKGTANLTNNRCSSLPPFNSDWRFSDDDDDDDELFLLYGWSAKDV